jgi:hypothetical protein
MRRVPAGYVSIKDAVNAVGRSSYGAEWIGDQANALMSMTGPARNQGARTAGEKALIGQFHMAKDQHQHVLEHVLHEIQERPTSFDIRILTEDGAVPIPAPPEIWDDDQKALYAIATGYLIAFRLPTGRELSGRLIIAVTALPQKTSSAAPRFPEPLPDGGAPVSDHHQPAKPKKPRVEKGIWRLARDEAFKYLEYEGTPEETGDQAKLEKHIAEYLGRKYSKHPAQSTIRKHVRGWIDECARPDKPLS